MLQTLKIKNVALISEIEIHFDNGFNVLLGETGAGKSIIFDALNFVLGAKPDKELLRSGESCMRVDALFSDLSEAVLSQLCNFGVCQEGELQIQIARQYQADGKSSIWINGVPATLSMLRSVAGLFLDSYSQHESMELLKSKNHLAMLDKLGGTPILNLKGSVASAYERFQNTLREIKVLGGDSFERERTKSLLEYQIKEIEEAKLYVGEDDEIRERMILLNSSEKIFDAVSTCETLLEDGATSAVTNVHEAASVLTQLGNFAEIEECRNRLNSCRYELQDIAETLKSIQENINFDEYELERLDRRNDFIKLLCKKYGGSIENVLAYGENAKVEFEKLMNSEERLTELSKLQKQQESELDALSNDLTNARKQVALEVEHKIVCQLRELGMKSTTFIVQFNSLQDFSANGRDAIEFTFSANKGQEAKSLAKTASGGEMSRFMLAFKNIFAEIGGAQTLIFDEIDAGISGEIGYVVGEKLHALTSAAQVICITHLAQVACHGDHFYYVSKQEDGATTKTKVELLQADRIILEIARMMSGNQVTDVALSHAKELLTRSKT